jgi:hypothetical protein
MEGMATDEPVVACFEGLERKLNKRKSRIIGPCGCCGGLVFAGDEAEDGEGGEG